MKKVINFIFPFYVVIVFILISCSSSTEPDEESENIRLLNFSKKASDSAINALYLDLSNICIGVAQNNFDESYIRTELNSILDKYQTATECVYVNESNVMTYIEPAEYQYAEGVDITNQEHQQQMINTKLPALSGIFKVVEGYYAVVFAAPIILDGKMMGSINIVIKPHEFISFYTDPYLKNSTTNKYKVDDFWVMETNGYIIYDTDPTQTGRNLFTDSLYLPYPELLAAGHTIIAGDSGKTYYSFLDKNKKKTVTKDVWWQTSSYYGKIWKYSIVKEHL